MCVVEHVGLQRLPDGNREICAGFHHDNQVGVAGNVESKLIRAYTKACIAGLRLRVPQHGWTAIKVRVQPVAPGSNKLSRSWYPRHA